MRLGRCEDEEDMGGGSSRVFRSALKAAVESICTSSTMYTFRRAPCGGIRTVSLKSRISSTRLFEAASISMTFRLRPSSKVRQCSQARHGSACPSRSSGALVQLIAFARMRAAVVLPTPRGPLKRYAWASRSSRIALRRVSVTCSCATSSSNRCGRYLRAVTRYLCSDMLARRFCGDRMGSATRFSSAYCDVIPGSQNVFHTCEYPTIARTIRGNAFLVSLSLETMQPLDENPMDSPGEPVKQV